MGGKKNVTEWRRGTSRQMKWGERKQQKFIDTIDATSATSIRYIVRYIDCFNISIQRDIDRHIDLLFKK